MSNIKSKLKICIVSSSDSKGGAAQIAQRLVRGLLGRNHETTFLVRSQKDASLESTLITDAMPSSITTKIASRIHHRRGVNSLCLTSPFPRKNKNVDFSAFDIVHLHDISGFNIKHLPGLAAKTNLIWTIHSMAPFTGNCIFSLGCDRWKQSCGQCPQYGSWPLDWLHKDGSEAVLKFKRKLYRRTNMNLVGVSEWITSQIRQSVMGELPTTTIQNAVDSTKYFPLEKSTAKLKLGISPEEKTVAFSVSSNPADLRKGFDIVVKAIGRVQTPITFLPMSIGDNPEALLESMPPNCKMLTPEHLSTPSELSRYYSAADLLWHPSRADTSSLVSMEAMSCGTPVIAADVGGVAEVVGRADDSEADSCGRLIPPDDPEALARSTDLLFNKPHRLAEMGQQARQRVKQRFCINRFTEEHLELYNRILEC